MTRCQRQCADRIFQLLTIWYAVMASSQAFALARTIYPVLQPNEARSYIQLIAAYGEDHRQVEEDYSKSDNVDLQKLKDQISPTGVIDCGGYRSTAQVTLSSRVITTTAHTFMDTDSCKIRTSPQLCRFTYTYRGHAETIEIKSLYQRGLTCPRNTNKADDWAVLTLQRPAVGPAPYKIDENKTLLAKYGDTIIAVEGLSADFCLKKGTSNICQRDHRGQFVLPRSIQDCVLKDIGYGDAMIFLTDCAASNGASGSGIFWQDSSGQYYMIGIAYTDAETDQEGKYEMSHGIAIVKPYDYQTWSESEIPVVGAFAAAIRNAAKSN